MEYGHVYLIQERFCGSYLNPKPFRCIDVTETSYKLMLYDLHNCTEPSFYVAKSDCHNGKGWFKSNPRYKIIERI